MKCNDKDCRKEIKNGAWFKKKQYCQFCFGRKKVAQKASPKQSLEVFYKKWANEKL